MFARIPTLVLAVIFVLRALCGATLARAEAAQAPDPMAHFYVFGLGLGLGVGGAVSWKYKQTWTGEFTTLNEGWFGKDTYAGGADKLGHFYTDFVLVRALNEIYSRHGYGETESIINAALGSMAIRTVMEVADGYTTFRFSPQDLAANTLGTVSSALLLAHPTLDRLISVSWTYLPSQEKLDGKVDWFSIDNDYNGSMYHLNFHLKEAARLMGSQASPVDLYTIGLSYETRGYDRERDYKQRILGLNLGLSLEELIGRHMDAGKGTNALKTLVHYYKVPFTYGGVTYDLDHQKYGVRFGLNYFY